MKNICVLSASLAFIGASLTGVAPAIASSAASPNLSLAVQSAHSVSVSQAHEFASTILPAADPLDLSNSQIYDPSNALESGIYQVQASVQSLETHDIKLYVAVLDNYSDYSPEEWNKKTIELTNMKPNSYLISLNLADKQFSASATSGSTLTSSEVNELALNFAAPQFSTGEFASGISSFAQQLIQRTMAVPSQDKNPAPAGATQTATNRWLIVTLLAAMVVAVVLAIAIYRRNSVPTANKKLQNFKEAAQQPHSEEPNSANYELETGDSTLKTSSPTDIGSNLNSNVEDEIEVATESSNVSEQELNYASALDQITKLEITYWSAQEDLSSTELLLGTPGAADFAAALNDTKIHIEALLAELAGSDGAMHTSRFNEMTVEISRLQQNLSLLVSQCTKMRHQPGKIKQDLDQLAVFWNRTRQSFKTVQAAQQQISNTYATSLIEHSKANLQQIIRLLKASHKGILAGQQSAKAGDESTASRYARGAERAMVQAGLAANNIQKLEAYLNLVSNEVNALQTQISSDLNTIRSGNSHASGPELAMAERMLESSNNALIKTDPTETLVKLCSIQINLYRAFSGQREISAKLSEIPAKLTNRLMQTEQLRYLLGTDMRLRRKHITPQMLVDLTRCDQLLEQVKLKMPTDPLMALSMLNTCTEMLVQTWNNLPAGFSQ